jgi:hypothetical protein
VRREVKLRIRNIIVKPVLHYGSQTWVLREGDKRRSEAFGMRFLRSLLGIPLRDKISTDI